MEKNAISRIAKEIKWFAKETGIPPLVILEEIKNEIKAMDVGARAGRSIVKIDILSDFIYGQEP